MHFVQHKLLIQEQVNLKVNPKLFPILFTKLIPN